MGSGGFGFSFSRKRSGYACRVAPSKGNIRLTFPGDVRVVDLEGNQTVIRSGEELVLTKTPYL